MKLPSADNRVRFYRLGRISSALGFVICLMLLPQGRLPADEALNSIIDEYLNSFPQNPSENAPLETASAESPSEPPAVSSLKDFVPAPVENAAEPVPDSPVPAQAPNTPSLTQEDGDVSAEAETTSRLVTAVPIPMPEQARVILNGGTDENLPQHKRVMLDSLQLRDMDIKDVLNLIAKKSGLNIVAGQNVSGRVTLFLEDIEVRDALRLILEANNLAFVEDMGVVSVMPDATFEQIYGYKFGRRTEARVISLISMKASDAVILLSQLKSPGGKVIADDQSNTVMLEDTPDKLKAMELYLKTIDTPTQVETFRLNYLQAEALAQKLQDILTPKLGSARFDTRSNKIFVRDTPERLNIIAAHIAEVDVAQATKVFALSYAKADALATTLGSILTEGLGYIEVDARSNQLIVRDTVSKIAEIGEIIAALDHRQEEVLIEARIIQIILQDEFRMGIDWETLVPDTHDLSVAGQFGGLGATASNKGVLSIGTLSEDRYTAVLEALSTVGNTSVLSNPRIAVLNNEEAKILIGTTKPYVTTTTTTPSSGPTTVSESVNFIDVGVKLFVTPIIHKDGFITMKIKPEVSSAATSIVTGNSNEIPVVDTSEVDTTVRVKDGVTIIIGGLIKDQSSDTVKKVPFLGDIPILGHAFRNTNRGVEKTEIVIFLTPHIISGDIHTGGTPAVDLSGISPKY